MKKLLLIPALALTLGACSNKEKQEAKDNLETAKAEAAATVNGTRTETKEVAKTLATPSMVTTVAFTKGKYALTPKAQSELNKLVEKAKQNGEIDKVRVAVWSDKEYPAEGTKLPAVQQDLAKERGDRIENYLEDKLKVGDVEVHNMAKRAGRLAEIFSTDDAELKQAFIATGAAPTTATDGFLTGAASTAVIMVKMK